MSNFDPASNLVGGVMVDENDSIDQQGSTITAAFLNGLQEEQTNLIMLLNGVPTFGDNNQIETLLPAYVASLIAAQARSPNHFADPCCRVAQGATPNLSTSKQYGAVDMVQAWVSSGSVSAGTIGQDASGAAGGMTPYSVHLAGVSLGVNSAISYRRWLESADAQDYIGGPCIVAATLFQDTGNDIPNVTITLNKANAANNFSAVTLIGTSGNLDLPNNTSKRVYFYVANMGACGNGIEMITTMPTGAAAVVTKDFYITDFQISPASVLAPFEVPKFGADYNNVLRWFEKSWPYGTAIASTGFPGQRTQHANIAYNGVGINEMDVFFKVEKGVVPTLTIYSEGTGASGKLRDATSGTDIPTSATVLGTTMFEPSAGSAIAAGDLLRMHWTADARL